MFYVARCLFTAWCLFTTLQLFTRSAMGPRSTGPQYQRTCSTGDRKSGSYSSRQAVLISVNRRLLLSLLLTWL